MNRLDVTYLKPGYSQKPHLGRIHIYGGLEDCSGKELTEYVLRALAAYQGV